MAAAFVHRRSETHITQQCLDLLKRISTEFSDVSLLLTKRGFIITPLVVEVLRIRREDHSGKRQNNNLVY